MIRLAVPKDSAALIALADASGLFQPGELEEVGAMLNASFESEAGSDPFWLADDDNGLVGIAYCEPERMTNGTWNLQLIAVHPGSQGQGRGTALLRSVEQRLAANGARLLLVETSGMETFERTRAFYRKCGYNEEARIRDFYDAGDDKIVFRKALIGMGK